MAKAIFAAALLVLAQSCAAQVSCGQGTVYDPESQSCVVAGSTETSTASSIELRDGDLHISSAAGGTVLLHARGTTTTVDVEDLASAIAAVGAIDVEGAVAALNGTLQAVVEAAATNELNIGQLDGRIQDVEDLNLDSRVSALEGSLPQALAATLDALNQTQLSLEERVRNVEQDLTLEIGAAANATAALTKAADLDSRVAALETMLAGYSASQALLTKMANCGKDGLVYSSLIDGCMHAQSYTPVDCQEINLRGQGSGVYSIDPDGLGGRPAFDVYCDNDSDGGGWTKLVQIQDPYTPTRSAFGDISEIGVTQSAKLDDTDINNLLSISNPNTDVYRLMSPDQAKRYYARFDTRSFDDTARAWNIFTGTRSTCLSNAYGSCSWCTTNNDSLDTIYDCHGDSEADRFFEQHAGSNVRCYASQLTDKRCVSHGNPPWGYAQFNDITLWVTRR